MPRFLIKAKEALINDGAGTVLREAQNCHPAFKGINQRPSNYTQTFALPPKEKQKGLRIKFP